MKAAILICMSLLLLVPPSAALAHGGEKHEAAQDKTMEESAAGESIYSAGQDEAPPLDLDDPLASPLSRSALDMEHEPMDAGMPMMEGMDHDSHAAQEQTVELAHHEVVSTSQKGYSLAVAITLLSGLVFGVMVFKKPGE